MLGVRVCPVSCITSNYARSISHELVRTLLLKVLYSGDLLEYRYNYLERSKY